MVSLFYSSNEKKQRKYIKDRQLEEINQANQQEIVDNALDKELGFEQKATKLSKLASRVIGKIGNEIVDDLSSTSFKSKLNQLNMSPLDYLKNSVENGTLSQLFDKIKVLPNSVLSRKQQIIRDDLNNPEIKALVNDELAAVASSGTDNIVNTVLEVLGGNGNNDDILDMVSKTIEKVKAKKATHNELLALADTSFSSNLGRHEFRRGPKPGSKNKTKDVTGKEQISNILSDMRDAVALKNDPQVKFRKNKKNLKLIKKYAQLIK